VAAQLAERIAARGPLRFDDVCEVALYDPAAGFYSTGGAAGRREGDFLTSVEVGPLFGAVVARLLDEAWDRHRASDRASAAGEPFVVVEAAAGRGALARSVEAAEPRCLPDLRYVLVERSAALRSRHAELGLGGPRWSSVADLDEVPRASAAVVLANELLDNLPVRLLERRGEGWAEVWVDAADGELVELLVEADAASAARADALAPAAPAGARVPLADRAVAWVGRALERCRPGGTLLLADYGRSTAELATLEWTDWLRTYRDHRRAGHPLAEPGTKDVTCEVPWDQLTAAHPGATLVDQVAFLRAAGIDDLVAEGRRTWHERAHLGDLQALRARSRVREADALLDPEGLGAFVWARWQAR
jgi:SAM-dependent MidA family methyltransferase